MENMVTHKRPQGGVVEICFAEKPNHVFAIAKPTHPFDYWQWEFVEDATWGDGTRTPTHGTEKSLNDCVKTLNSQVIQHGIALGSR